MRERVRAAPSSTEPAHIRHFLFRQFLFTQSGNPEIVLLVSVAKKKKQLLLVKLSRWRAKKSGPKFKMKIVFCISTNIRHDMHCFLNTTFNNQDCVIRYVCTLSRVEKSIQYYVDLLARQVGSLLGMVLEFLR